MRGIPIKLKLEQNHSSLKIKMEIFLRVYLFWGGGLKGGRKGGGPKGGREGGRKDASGIYKKWDQIGLIIMLIRATNQEVTDNIKTCNQCANFRSLQRFCILYVKNISLFLYVVFQDRQKKHKYVYFIQGFLPILF